ncbi:hypothetical protein E2C01_069682 [Portunus trituberculatus]|uniref:Uncharacterized protein n=1 Tax=Portunus trituberculatus TaxID=210409 RepID=A0A5B7I020_PORTR|nr:hypothetical protein [Portunus trituberculatus]
MIDTSRRAAWECSGLWRQLLALNRLRKWCHELPNTVILDNRISALLPCDITLLLRLGCPAPLLRCVGPVVCSYSDLDGDNASSGVVTRTPHRTSRHSRLTLPLPAAGMCYCPLCYFF